MSDIMVVNVDTWGSGPNALTRGSEVPSDCPGDIEWAKEHKVIVTADEYRQEHPEWRPPGAREEEAAPKEEASTTTSTPKASTTTTRSGSSSSSSS